MIFTRNSSFAFLILFFSFSLNAQNTSTYEKEMQSWQQKRIQALKDQNGWINLTGLFWLKPGKNSFGSAPTNDFVYQHKNMPSKAGYFLWENQQVYWVSNSGISIKINDSLITKALVFEEGKNQASLMALGSLRGNIIQREEKIGVRLRDLASPLLTSFKGTERFALDSNLKLIAHLEPVQQNKLLIANVLGQISPLASPGKLVFNIKGTTYTLDALEEGEELFILFGDATSGKETYPAGRFLYTNKPDANGNTILDFNKAFNPPCAFTKFATCPLPPKQNILPIAIKAGEKNYHSNSLK
ncbi:MAG: DUF1684 domain-containing protein [Bacteroidetes bacterium]|nr:DUF1684 domain-containing protein [Bacteroidota bacterium]